MSKKGEPLCRIATLASITVGGRLSRATVPELLEQGSGTDALAILRQLRPTVEPLPAFEIH